MAKSFSLTGGIVLEQTGLESVMKLEYPENTIIKELQVTLCK